MISKQQPSDSMVVLYGIPWEMYERILDALGKYHLRHTYDRGALETPGLLHSVSWQEYMRFLDTLGDLALKRGVTRTHRTAAPSTELTMNVKAPQGMQV